MLLFVMTIPDQGRATDLSQVDNKCFIRHVLHIKCLSYLAAKIFRSKYLKTSLNVTANFNFNNN